MATGSEVKEGQIPPGWPPAGSGTTCQSIPRQAVSACGPYREWIEAQVRLGRNAISIYQDLVEQQGFKHKGGPHNPEPFLAETPESLYKTIVY